MKRRRVCVTVGLAVCVTVAVVVILRGFGPADQQAGLALPAASTTRAAEATAAPQPTPKPTAKPAPKARARATLDTTVASPRRGTVYLTFDDGPSRYTPAVLRILRRTGSTATFFEMGIRWRRHPDLVQAVLGSGSTIGNHTDTHPDLTQLSAAQIRAELAAGPRGRCVRPPFGATNARVRSVLRAMGFRQVLWTSDTLDWRRPGVREIILRSTPPWIRNGSIVLLHDGGGDRSQTVAALPVVIQTLHRHGYVVSRLPGC